MLASATANNDHVFDAAVAHGMSFGLGVVTVSLPMLPGVDIAGHTLAATARPYIARLAWIGVVTPDLVAACPVVTTSITPAPTRQGPHLPYYEILAIDAATGADGIIYRAPTNGPCGNSGGIPATVAPAVEFVSLPWTLVARGPGLHSAMLSYQARPCDQQSDLPTLIATGQPVVIADPNRPGLVTVGLERILTACGPPAPARIVLRSSSPTADLPEHLTHAPVGAQDVSGN